MKGEKNFQQSHWGWEIGYKKGKGELLFKIEIRLKGPKNNEFKKKRRRRRKQGAGHTPALPFTLKRILRQKKK